MNERLWDEIKSRGYWRMNFRPVDPAALNSLTLDQCLRVTQEAEVQLRGWYYPHVPRRVDADSGIRRMDRYVESWTDWMGHRDLWRMYESSQFLHYRALKEDWRQLDTFMPDSAPTSGREPIELPVLGVVNNLWLLVEVFEFLARLHQRGLYGPGADVSLQLHRGTVDDERTLWIEDQRRMPFSYPRTNGAAVLTYKRTFAPAEVVERKQRAAEAARFFFDKFGWTPSDDQLAKEIDDLYRL